VASLNPGPNFTCRQSVRNGGLTRPPVPRAAPRRAREDDNRRAGPDRELSAEGARSQGGLADARPCPSERTSARSRGRDTRVEATSTPVGTGVQFPPPPPLPLDVVRSLWGSGLRALPASCRPGACVLRGVAGIGRPGPSGRVPSWLSERPESAYPYAEETLARFRRLVDGEGWRDPAWNAHGTLEVVHEKTGLGFVLVSPPPIALPQGVDHPPEESAPPLARRESHRMLHPDGAGQRRCTVSMPVRFPPPTPARRTGIELAPRSRLVPGMRWRGELGYPTSCMGRTVGGGRGRPSDVSRAITSSTTSHSSR
jgi:hypothetical protein